jgi:hypothetical protein
MLPKLTKLSCLYDRFDESYSIKRKIALQDYLRILVKIPVIREKSDAFRTFIDMPYEAKKLYDEVLDYMIRIETEGKYDYEDDYRSRGSLLEVSLHVNEGNPQPLIEEDTSADQEQPDDAVAIEQSVYTSPERDIGGFSKAKPAPATAPAAAVVSPVPEIAQPEWEEQTMSGEEKSAEQSEGGNQDDSRS